MRYKYGISKKRKAPWLFIISSLVFVAVMVLLALAKSSYGAADFINGTLSSAYRQAMAAFGNLFPFSLFEIVIALALPLIILLIAISVRCFKTGRGGKFLLSLLSAVLLVYSGHTLALGMAYHTTPLATRLDIKETEVNEQSLARTLILLREEINSLSEKIEYTDAGASTSGLALNEISEKICASYSELSGEYSFIPDFQSRVKGVHFSEVLSYLSLTGIYTFYTGESNVNTLYPDYDVVFTAAHELAHQRGILRENEANFMAYLACRSSEDDYLRYSAALSMYGYIGSALYRTNRELYGEINAELCDGARADMRASNEVYKEYSGTVFEDISSTVNDLFLKSNGTEGVVSYGMVVKLAVAYHEANGH